VGVVGGGGGGGSSYLYATYFGGTGGDSAYGIAVDASGNAFIVGQTQSTDFPVTSTTFQSTLAAGAIQNAFLMELNATGTTATYSTYLGGNGTDFAYAVVVDANDVAYLTGQTSSSNFPTANATQATFGGSTDAFISVLDTVTNTLTFSTYLGGSGDENQLSAGIALDSSNNMYVTGDTDSGNGSTTPFPTFNPFDSAWSAGGPCLNSNNLTVPCPDGFVAAFTAP
jgi:hypothetical protein